MALLGFMSLSGMLLKNAIVLVDEINTQRNSGKDDHAAIVDSAISRLRPVGMAAATTILGMLPLVVDAFFVSMAVTVMFGLGFATVLTMVVVPNLFAILLQGEVAGTRAVDAGAPQTGRLRWVDPRHEVRESSHGPNGGPGRRARRPRTSMTAAV